jgi:hypothetical protein
MLPPVSGNAEEETPNDSSRFSGSGTAHERSYATLGKISKICMKNHIFCEFIQII